MTLLMTLISECIPCLSISLTQTDTHKHELTQTHKDTAWQSSIGLHVDHHLPLSICVSLNGEGTHANGCAHVAI